MSRVNEGFEDIVTPEHNEEVKSRKSCNERPEENWQGSEDPKVTEEKVHEADVIYGVEDVPPWYMCIFLGLQHYLTMFGATVSIPFFICPAMCIEDDDPARGYIISTIFLVSGIVTFLQATFGIRLPIVQGGTFSFLAPTFAILSLPENICPEDFATRFTADEKTEEWQKRMRQVQGAICVASSFQLFIGYFGIIGLMLKFISPLTIAPAVAMIGLSLFDVAADIAAKNWRISMGTVLLMVVFSQYMRNLKVPCPSFTDGKCAISRIQLFKLFPVLLTIVVMWSICGILTVTNVLPEGDPGRTDVNVNLLYKADWIRFPYPFQWGWPTVTLAGVAGMLAGVIASAIESVGDYYACARLSGAPPPPTHAINRGIGTEGLGCIIAGIWGTGNGTTSYSENIGAIGVTKVGSRRVIQWGAVIMIAFGLLSKFGAFFLTIPEPIVGGMFCVMFGMIAAVGLSNLQYVDHDSTRNLFILGFSLFFGLALPKWIQANPSAIQVGNAIADQVITVLLSTSMFVSGALGFFLDNTVPGTPQERGLDKWKAVLNHHQNVDESNQSTCYDLPVGMTLIRRMKWTRFVPCLPTYKGIRLSNILPLTSKDRTNTA